MKIYCIQKGELCLLNALTKLVLGKLMTLTIKIAPECATFDTERGGTQSGLLFYASYCGGMLMLRFINYQNIVSVNFDHAQKFQNYAQMSETTANPETLEAVGGAGEKLDWDLLFILPDGQMSVAFKLETGLSRSSQMVRRSTTRLYDDRGL